MQLYAALALAATLASLVATHLRSSNYMGQFATPLAVGTCGLLVLAWAQLLIAGASAWRDVWSHLTAHLLIIGVMLPIVCVTVCLSWIAGAKDALQQWGAR